MRAVVYHQYGSPDVLRVTDVAQPTPGDDEVLLKIHAASVNGSDREALIGKPLYARMRGWRRPAHPILGSDIAGVVEAAGANHTRFQVGDEVFGELPGYHGGFADYACTAGDTLALKPTGLSFEEAAAIPQAGTIALRGIRQTGNVQPGQHILINGAGGAAGTFAVQLAKLAGAEVTAVDNGGKAAFLQSLGADHVIDYAAQDFTRGAVQYDLILDVIAHRSAFAYARALRRGGTLFVVGGSAATMLQILPLGPLIKLTTKKRLRILIAPQNNDDLLVVAELCLAGELRPIIDRTYPLAEAREALRHVAEGRANGKVVITMT